MGASDEVSTDRIRNVALVGHGGTGKTTVAEALLGLGDAGRRDGGILDYEPDERERGHSLGLSVATMRWREHKLNLLDTPGEVDFIGDAYPALRAADAVVFVVDATAGVQAQHDQLWDACEDLGLPRLVFLNKLDRDHATYQPVIESLRERAGSSLAPVHLPIGMGSDFLGVVDLLRFTAVRFSDGERVEEAVPDELAAAAAANRELLVEAVVETDDALLERYLDGDVPETKELADVLAEGVASCGVLPVLCGAAARGIGAQLLADFLVGECPSPATRGPVKGRDETRELDGPTAAYVAKTLSDPYLGRINVMRVLTGRVDPDDVLIVDRTDEAVKLRHLFGLRGKEHLPVVRAPAGDLVAVSKLENVRTGDVLHAKESPFSLDPVEPPQPFHRVGLEPLSTGDEDKLSTALARAVDEDPSLRAIHDPETGQLQLHTYGPVHAEATVARLERKYGVSVQQVPVRIGYRETPRWPASGTGRHVKQSGGHGQYGIAHVEIEPLARGAGFVFEDRIVGGVIPRQWIPSVEKGVREAMAGGVMAGYPVVDVKVALVDGKHHSVDSSDWAFQMAGALAFTDAARNAGMVLLEPLDAVEVTVPDELTGDIMGDLSARRGRIQGTLPAGHGRTTVSALVPQAELRSYAGELRSLTSGAGVCSMRYDHHDEVPESLVDRLLAEVNADTANGSA